MLVNIDQFQLSEDSTEQIYNNDFSKSNIVFCFFFCDLYDKISFYMIWYLFIIFNQLKVKFKEVLL